MSRTARTGECRSPEAVPRHWAVIPAAGFGRRMGGETPKQYLSLRGRTVIEHSVSRILRHPQVDGVVVATREKDPWWPHLELAAHGGIATVTGDAQRSLSVLRGLDALDGRAADDDWVMVHDAVRPCIRAADIDRLIEAAAGGAPGAVLGIPARDALKRVDEWGRVLKSVDRGGLWHAQTPQVFRFGALRRALELAVANGEAAVGDESQAMEAQGVFAVMVEGHPDNIKVTWPGDLALAELYLAAQGEDA